MFCMSSSSTNKLQLVKTSLHDVVRRPASPAPQPPSPAERIDTYINLLGGRRLLFDYKLLLSTRISRAFFFLLSCS